MESEANLLRHLQAVRNRDCWVFGNHWRGCNLKQFGGLTWLTRPDPQILRQIDATESWNSFESWLWSSDLMSWFWSRSWSLSTKLGPIKMSWMYSCLDMNVSFSSNVMVTSYCFSYELIVRNKTINDMRVSDRINESDGMVTSSKIFKQIGHSDFVVVDVVNHNSDCLHEQWRVSFELLALWYRITHAK